MTITIYLHFILWSFLFSLALGFCQDNEHYVQIIKYSSDNAHFESFSIKSGSDIILVSPVLVDNTDQLFSYCLKSSLSNFYSLELKHRYTRWNDLSKIVIMDSHDSIIFEGTMTSLLVDTYHFSLKYCINDNSKWKTRHITEDANWESDVAISSSWNQTIPFSDNTILSPTFYTVVINPYIPDVIAWKISFRYICGIILYINGVNIYYDNVNTLSDKYASGCYMKTKVHSIVISTSVIHNQETIIAVKLLSTKDNPSKIMPFYAWLLPLLSSLSTSNSLQCYMYSMKPKVSNNDLVSGDLMFDGFIGTASTMKLVDSIGHISFHYDDFDICVNGFMVYSPSPIAYSLTGASFYGSIDNEIKTKILSINAQPEISDKWSHYISSESFDFLSYFEIEIENTLVDSTFVIPELHPIICSPIPLQYKHEYILYTTIIFSISPLFGPVKDCVMASSLPLLIEFDPKSCSLKGLSTNVSDLMVHITSPHDDIHFNITFIRCGTVVTICRTTEKNSLVDSVSVVSLSGIVMFMELTSSRVPINNVIETQICLPDDDYELITTSLLPSWDDKIWISVAVDVVFDYHDNIAVSQFDPDIGYFSVSLFSLHVIIDYNSMWSYHFDDIPSNWSTCNIASWNKSADFDSLFSDNQIQLYRKDFSLSDSEVNDIQSLQFVIKYKNGLIILINGIEVFRNGLTGDVELNNFGSQTYLFARNRLINVSSHQIISNAIIPILHSGSNTIAVAMIATMPLHTRSTFNIYIRSIKFPFICSFEYILISYPNSVNHSEGSFISRHIEIDDVFSMSRDCSVDIESSTAFTRIIGLSFTGDSRKYVNRMTMRAKLNTQKVTQDINCKECNVTFVMQGQNGELSEWEDVMTVGPLKFNCQYKRYFISLPIALKSFSSLRLTQFVLICDSILSISNIVFYQDKTIETTLRYPSALYGIVGNQFPDNSPDSIMFTEFSSSKMPHGLYIDTMTGSIMGVAEESFDGDVMITGKSRNKQLTTTAHIVVMQCDTMSEAIGVKIDLRDGYYSGECRITNKEGVFFRWNNWSKYQPIFYFEFCLNWGEYSFTCDPVPSLNHIYSAFLYLVPSHFEFHSITINHNSSLIHFSSRVPTSDSTIYYIFNISSSFFNSPQHIIFNSNSWIPSNRNNIPNDVSNLLKRNDMQYTQVLYLAKSFEVPDVEHYSVINFKGYIDGGIIVYLNRIKIARFNVDIATNGSYILGCGRDKNTPIFFHAVLPYCNVSNGINWLLFEYYLTPEFSPSDDITFQIDAAFGIEEISPVLDSYVRFGSEVSMPISMDPLYFVYHTERSYYQTEWKIENLERSIYNVIGLWSMQNIKGIRWELQDIKDDEKVNVLSSCPLFDMNSDFVNYVPFPAANTGNGRQRLVMRGNNDFSSSQIFSLRMLMMYNHTSYRHCGGNGDYPIIPVEQFLMISAIPLFSGVRYRLCQIDESFGPLKYDLMYPQIPVSVVYGSNHFFFLIGLFETTGEPESNAAMLDFFLSSNQHVLPKGLKLDSKTGEICGVPVEENNGTYEIYVSNQSGAIIVSVTITVNTIYCVIDNNKTVIPGGSVIRHNCKDDGNYIGFMYKKCAIVNRKGELVAHSGFCMKKSIIYLILVLGCLTIFIVICKVYRVVVSHIMYNRIRRMGNRMYESLVKKRYIREVTHCSSESDTYDELIV